MGGDAEDHGLEFNTRNAQMDHIVYFSPILKFRIHQSRTLFFTFGTAPTASKQDRGIVPI